MADLQQERRGAVHIFRLNRPEARNALNAEIITGIGRGLQEADADPEVRAVVITGTGDRAFCAGMDLRGFAEGTNAGSADADREGPSLYQQFIRRGAAKPVVGAA